MQTERELANPSWGSGRNQLKSRGMDVNGFPWLQSFLKIGEALTPFSVLGM